MRQTVGRLTEWYSPTDSVAIEPEILVCGPNGFDFRRSFEKHSGSGLLLERLAGFGVVVPVALDPSHDLAGL